MWRLYLVNGLTLVRVPVIGLLVYLAFADVNDEATIACVAWGVGLFSHYFDGVLAEWLGLEFQGPGDFWHEADTAWFSLGLQLGGAVWLSIGQEAFAWWLILAYLALTFALEFGYVQYQKHHNRPFVPVVLLGSVVVWIGLTALIASEADISVGPAIAIPLLLVLLHSHLHSKVWDRWLDECRAGGPERRL